MSTTSHLGVDVSKHTLEICILDGSRAVHASFPNNREGFLDIARWLHERTFRVAMEATGRYHERFALFCIAQGWSTYVLDPKGFHNWCKDRHPRGHKTDRIDARMLAECLQETHHRRSPWVAPAAVRRQLRELTRRLSQLTEMMTQEKNRAGHLPFAGEVEESHSRVLALLEQEYDQVKAALDELIEGSEVLSRQLSRLLEIPSCGEVLARTVLAELGDVTRFEKAKDVTAWVGLVPRQHQSGTSVRKSERIPRGGNPRLRQMLYMGALSAMHPRSKWAAWVEPRKERGKEGKVLLVAMMDKLLRVMWGVLKNDEAFELEKALGGQG